MNFPKTSQTGETPHSSSHTPPPQTQLLMLETRPLTQRAQLANIPAGETHLTEVRRFRNYATLLANTTHLAVQVSQKHHGFFSVQPHKKLNH